MTKHLPPQASFHDAAIHHSSAIAQVGKSWSAKAVHASVCMVSVVLVALLLCVWKFTDVKCALMNSIMGMNCCLPLLEKRVYSISQSLPVHKLGASQRNYREDSTV